VKGSGFPTLLFTEDLDVVMGGTAERLRFG
jgi:hypothetical protein